MSGGRRYDPARGRSGLLRVVLQLAVLVSGAPVFAAEGDPFPPDARYIDVKAEYGATCDGITDDTASFRHAIEQARPNQAQGRRILFIPEGTCLVSAPLTWREDIAAGGAWLNNLSLVGAGRDRTTIKLRDGAEGFQDANEPRALLYTASVFEADDKPSRNANGSGNKAFFIHISDLTVDVGMNPAAVGIDFLANNVGSIRNVRVRAPPGAGYAGIQMDRYGPGPCLLSRVIVEGFDYGIRVSQFDYGVTLEHITLQRQGRAGLYNRDNTLSVRLLESRNTVAAVQNAGKNGLIVLLDSTLDGGAPGSTAILNSGRILVRNLRASGYSAAISGVPGLSITEYASAPPQQPFAGESPHTLSLPIRDAPPTFEATSPDHVANVASYGAIAWDGIDDSAAFQAAMNSGKPVVYASTGGYHLAHVIRVPRTVRLIDLMASTLKPAPGRFQDARVEQDVFRVDEAAGDPLFVRRFGASGFAGANVLHQASQRTLVVADVNVGRAGQILVDPDAGDVFLEDVGAGSLKLGPRAHVWARQLDLETSTSPELSVNEGGTLWVLGLKTEGPRTVNRTLGGGCTEILGGLIYPVRSVPASLPTFVVVDASASFTYNETAYFPDARYSIHILERRGKRERKLSRTALAKRGHGSTVTLGTASGSACPSSFDSFQ